MILCYPEQDIIIDIWKWEIYNRRKWKTAYVQLCTEEENMKKVVKFGGSSLASAEQFKK